MDLANATVAIVRLFLIVTMLGVGLQLGLRGMGGVVVARGWVLGMLAVNVVLLPAIGVLVCFVLRLEGEVAIGLLACAVAPAGSLAPKLVQLAHGDLARGVLATFGLSALATLSVPPTLAVGARILGIDEAGAAIDVLAVMVSLAIFQLSPMVVGVVLARRSPGTGQRALTSLILVSNGLIGLIILVAVLDTADDLLAVGPLPMLGIVIVALVGHVAGRRVGRPDPALQRASALVSAQRSPGLALLVVAGPGHPVATATVVVATLGLTALNVVAAVLYGRSGPPREAATPPASAEPAATLDFTHTG